MSTENVIIRHILVQLDQIGIAAAWWTPMKNAAVWAIILFALIAISRLPYLDAGYGANIDAWRVARAARSIAQTGSYRVSRFPGYPVHEIACSFFWKGGPIALNALSAISSMSAAAALWVIARRLKCQDSMLIAAAFAFTPVIFVNSVTSKDYLWALAFVLWAVVAAMDDRPLLSGVLLGLATGCRITSGAMVLPITVILFRKHGWRGSIRFVCATGVIACLVFTPVFYRYGWNFFTFAANHARPDAITILKRATIEVWGTVGISALLIAITIALLLFRKLRQRSIEKMPKNLVAALGAIVCLYLIAYLRLPDQAGYLCPIVPVILLLLGRFSPRPVFQALSVCLLAAGWQAMTDDHNERVRTVHDVKRFVIATDKLFPGQNTVVVGGWEPIISVLYPESHNRYIYLLSPTEAKHLAPGSVAYASEVIREFNYRVYGIDLAAIGAQNVRLALVGRP